MPIERLITATVIGRSQTRSSALLHAAWITISEPAATATGIKSQFIVYAPRLIGTPMLKSRFGKRGLMEGLREVA
jgi:hypothetical protein